MTLTRRLARTVRFYVTRYRAGAETVATHYHEDYAESALFAARRSRDPLVGDFRLRSPPVDVTIFGSDSLAEEGWRLTVHASVVS